MKYIIFHFSNIYITPKNPFESHISKQIKDPFENRHEAIDTAHNTAEQTATTLLVEHIESLEEVGDGHIFNIFEVREYDKSSEYTIVFRSIERRIGNKRYHTLKIYTK